MEPQVQNYSFYNKVKSDQCFPVFGIHFFFFFCEERGKEELQNVYTTCISLLIHSLTIVFLYGIYSLLINPRTF